MTITSVPPSRSPAVGFAVRLMLLSLALFGALRLPLVEKYFVVPLAELEGSIAHGVVGPGRVPVTLAASCSGTDAMALLFSVLFAYPATRSARLRGLVAGLALIIGVNIVRIGHLTRAAGTPAFDPLHLYVWPAILTLAVAGFAFSWMFRQTIPVIANDLATAVIVTRARLTRFVVLSLVLLVAFVVMSPWYLDSRVLWRMSAWIAACGTAILDGLGASARCNVTIVKTSRGAFRVTPECIATPLLPVLVAAALTWVSGWQRRSIALLLVLPIVISLGVARLLVLAVPAFLAPSPLVWIHAFNQLIVAAVLVVGLSLWRRGDEPLRASLIRGARALALSSVVFVVITNVSARLVTATATTVVAVLGGDPPSPAPDPQGALSLLPGLAIALFVGIVFGRGDRPGWKRSAVAVAVLLAVAIAVNFALMCTASSGFAFAARELRAVTLAIPLAVAYFFFRPQGRTPTPAVKSS